MYTLFVSIIVLICCSYGLSRINGLRISYNQHEFDWQFCSILSKNNSELYDIGCERYMNYLCMNKGLEICKLRKNMINIIEVQHTYTYILIILLSFSALLILIKLTDIIEYISRKYCIKNNESEQNLIENVV